MADVVHVHELSKNEKEMLRTTIPLNSRIVLDGSQSTSNLPPVNVLTVTFIFSSFWGRLSPGVSADNPKQFLLSLFLTPTSGVGSDVSMNAAVSAHGTMAATGVLEVSETDFLMMLLLRGCAVELCLSRVNQSRAETPPASTKIGFSLILTILFIT